jgi:hypothetical protein
VVAILLVPVQLLVLLDRVVFVDVFILDLVLVAGEQTERRAEQVRVARGPSVLLGVAGSFAEFV